MNAIEQRFFDAFYSYLCESPSASIHSDSWEMKIAEYKIDKKDIESKSDSICGNIHVLFPTLQEEIKLNHLSIYLTPQQSVGSYTIDFELMAEGFVGDIIRLAIEIDGHDFHEKTKEQARYDKRRDREIAMNNYIILRFTGSEIYTNSIKCVQEVMTILISLIFERYIKYADWYIEESKYFDSVINGDVK